MRKQLCWLFNVTLLFSEVPSASSSHRPTKREFHYQLKWEKGKRKTKPINNVGQEREDKILPSQQDIIIDNGVHSCYLNGSLKAVIQATVDNRDISLLSESIVLSSSSSTIVHLGSSHVSLHLPCLAVHLAVQMANDHSCDILSTPSGDRFLLPTIAFEYSTCKVKWLETKNEQLKSSVHIDLLTPTNRLQTFRVVVVRMVWHLIQ